MKFHDLVFPTVEDVIAIHARGIARFGGDPAVRDRGLVESAALAPQTGYYDSLAELAAVLAFGLAKNHGFVDGNKRVAFLVTDTFLRLNGFALVLDVDKWEVLMVGVASGTVTRDEIADAIAEEMGGDVPIE